MKGDEEQSYLTCGMPPSCVVRVISASLSGLLLKDLVPRMHVMDDRMAAKDSLHLSQLMTTGYCFCCFEASISASLL